MTQTPARPLHSSGSWKHGLIRPGKAGGAYAAPAETMQSFLEGRGKLELGRVQPTYDRGVVPADLGALLPQELAQTLRAGLRAYERKIAGVYRTGCGAYRLGDPYQQPGALGAGRRSDLHPDGRAVPLRRGCRAMRAAL